MAKKEIDREWFKILVDYDSESAQSFVAHPIQDEKYFGPGYHNEDSPLKYFKSNHDGTDADAERAVREVVMNAKEFLDEMVSEYEGIEQQAKIVCDSAKLKRKVGKKGKIPEGVNGTMSSGIFREIMGRFTYDGGEHFLRIRVWDSGNRGGEPTDVLLYDVMFSTDDNSPIDLEKKTSFENASSVDLTNLKKYFIQQYEKKKESELSFDELLEDSLDGKASTSLTKSDSGAETKYTYQKVFEIQISLSNDSVNGTLSIETNDGCSEIKSIQKERNDRYSSDLVNEVERELQSIAEDWHHELQRVNETLSSLSDISWKTEFLDEEKGLYAEGSYTENNHKYNISVSTDVETDRNEISDALNLTISVQSPKKLGSRKERKKSGTLDNFLLFDYYVLVGGLVSEYEEYLDEIEDEIEEQEEDEIEGEDEDEDVDDEFEEEELDDSGIGHTESEDSYDSGTDGFDDIGGGGDLGGFE